MTNLVLELKPGEMMLINGASIRFRTKGSIELTARARFLFGKQVMASEDANSPAERIYYTLQTVYIGAQEDRIPALKQLHELIVMVRDDTRSTATQVILDTIEQKVLADDCYTALKLARRIIRHEASSSSR